MANLQSKGAAGEPTTPSLIVSEGSVLQEVGHVGFTAPVLVAAAIAVAARATRITAEVASEPFLPKRTFSA
ncbi:MAG: hypothetical protein COC07_03495, partial [Erythrobacteraceae bacterium]